MTPGCSSPQGAATFRNVIADLGLTSNLKLCLDAGDQSSYDGGTSWLDTSGNGYNFFLGATGGAEASDPTFRGALGSGDAKNTHFSFDSNNYFRYDTTSEAWMNNIHKNNAVFTLCAWVDFGGTGTNSGICGNNTGGITVGFHWRKATGESPMFVVTNGTGSVISVTMVADVAAAGTYTFLAISLTEATGASGCFMQCQSTVETFTSTYTSPSAAAAGFTLDIGCGGNGSMRLPNNSRMSSFAAWEGTALSQASVNNIFNATRGRHGV